MNNDMNKERPKRGLGRGLDALFGVGYSSLEPKTQPELPILSESETFRPDSDARVSLKWQTQSENEDFGIKTQFDENTNRAAVVELKVINLEPNSTQPRKRFDREKLEALAESIRNHGLIQPVLVTPTSHDTYQIVAGERRWRAAKMAGIKTVPCIVREYSAREVMEIALIENLQREDLNPIEEAEGYKKLMLTFGLTQEVISERVGKSRPAVANALRLNNLPDEIKAMLIDDKLSGGHARALLGISDSAAQMEIAEKIIAEGLSVRQTEAIISGISAKKTEKPKSKVDKALLRYYMDIEKLMGNHLGTKVKILPGKVKSKIEIEYYTREDLERLLEQLSPYNIISAP